jgi:hypothetical protein
MTLVDPISAFFSGFTSTPARLLLFFLGALLGHAVGLVSAYTIDGTPFAVALDFSRIAGLPVSFLWQILQNFLFAPGIGYVLLLGLLFFLILFTEVLPVISLSLLVILQVWDTFYMQREYASHPYIFQDAPHFSDWGYAIAGSVTFLAILLAGTPFVLSIASRRA